LRGKEEDDRVSAATTCARSTARFVISKDVNRPRGTCQVERRRPPAGSDGGRLAHPRIPFLARVNPLLSLQPTNHMHRHAHISSMTCCVPGESGLRLRPSRGNEPLSGHGSVKNGTWTHPPFRPRRRPNERREAQGERREARGARRETRGERREAQGERRKARGERREAQGERRKARGEMWVAHKHAGLGHFPTFPLGRGSNH